MKNALFILASAALLAGSANPLYAQAGHYFNNSTCTWTVEVLSGDLRISGGASTPSCTTGVRCAKNTSGELYCILNPSCTANAFGMFGTMQLTPNTSAPPPNGGGPRQFGVNMGGLGGHGGFVELNTPGRGDITINTCVWGW